MNILEQAWTWLTNPANWTNNASIPTRICEHLTTTLLVMTLSALIAIPLGILIGHTGRGITLAVTLSNGLRSLPTLGLITLIGLWVGIGLTAPTAALIIMAIPPLLAGTYTGIQSIEPATIDAARAIGMPEPTIITTVEIPLAFANIIAGIRSATIQVISTVTVAAYIANAGLGRYIFAGLNTQDYGQMIGGAILVVLVALTTDAALAAIGRLLCRRITPHEFTKDTAEAKPIAPAMKEIPA